MSTPYEFIPLHYGDKLSLVNPKGTVGIITLWSKQDYIAGLLKDRGVDMSPSSPVAVLGNLFGEGIRYLLRNLLYNPQIDTLMLIGNNLSGSAERLEDFFGKGVEPIDSPTGAAIEYAPDGDGPVFPCRIVGSNQIVDSRVRPECFSRPPRIWRPGERTYLPAALDEAAAFLRDEYKPLAGGPPERVNVSVPQMLVESCPSDVENHGVVADDVLDAWKGMLRKVCRFGKKVELFNKDKGERKYRHELRNFKAVIVKPRYDESVLEKDGNFDAAKIDEIRRYRVAILEGALPPDQPYAYGNRLREYYGGDLLLEVARSLRTDYADGRDGNPDNRKHYISLWDSFVDFTSTSSSAKNGVSKTPCLVTVYFRKDGGSIHMTACFRTHNASNAWIVNAYGLMAVQEFVCAEAGAHPGSLTIISYSLGIDPKYMEGAKRIAAGVKTKFRQDPNGYIEVGVRDGAVVVEHKSLASGSIASYVSGSRDEMFRRLVEHDVFSQVSHALYAGAEIQRAFACLKEGVDFIQDNA